MVPPYHSHMVVEIMCHYHLLSSVGFSILSDKKVWSRPETLAKSLADIRDLFETFSTSFDPAEGKIRKHIHYLISLQAME